MTALGTSRAFQGSSKDGEGALMVEHC